MSDAKVVSIVDHEIRRSRAAIDETLTRLQLHLSTELVDLQAKVAQLRADVDLLLYPEPDEK
jgi:hypothetical protein